VSASEAKTFTVPAGDRRFLLSVINDLAEGWRVRIMPPGRSLDQNAKAHALFQDIARAKPEWNGLRMDAEDWKALLVVSHAVATQGKGGLRLVPDLEGRGLVQLRESTARMSKARASSLIEYVTSWAVAQGIPLSEMQP
jgi:hypothetical protein